MNPDSTPHFLGWVEHSGHCDLTADNSNICNKHLHLLQFLRVSNHSLRLHNFHGFQTNRNQMCQGVFAKFPPKYLVHSNSFNPSERDFMFASSKGSASPMPPRYFGFLLLMMLHIINTVTISQTQFLFSGKAGEKNNELHVINAKLARTPNSQLTHGPRKFQEHAVGHGVQCCGKWEIPRWLFGSSAQKCPTKHRQAKWLRLSCQPLFFYSQKFGFGFWNRDLVPQRLEFKLSSDLWPF